MIRCDHVQLKRMEQASTLRGPVLLLRYRLLTARDVGELDLHA